MIREAAHQLELSRRSGCLVLRVLCFLRRGCNLAETVCNRVIIFVAVATLSSRYATARPLFEFEWFMHVTRWDVDCSVCPHPFPLA